VIDKVNACSCNVSSAFPAYTASSPLTETVVFSPSLSLSLALCGLLSSSLSPARRVPTSVRMRCLLGDPRTNPTSHVKPYTMKLSGCAAQPNHAVGGGVLSRGEAFAVRPAQLYLPQLAWPRRSYLASPAAVCVRLASCVPSAPRETRWDPQTPTRLLQPSQTASGGAVGASASAEYQSRAPGARASEPGPRQGEM
jgi:hypothetical protein